jgi:hypothetical protein
MKLKLTRIFLTLTSVTIIKVSFSSTIIDPCANLLSIVNRPTVADSACAVPYREALLELGYQYQNLKGGGSGYTLPQAEFRLGLPYQNEILIILPNYNHHSTTPHTGYDATAVGFKHEIGYNEQWLGAMDGLITLPSGSAAFGSNNVGTTLNGVIEYDFTPSLSLSLMLGVESQTLPHSEGGERFTSINPDLVLSWQLNEKSVTYAEIYGQTKTGPNIGSGFGSDLGLIYLLTSHIEADIEIGQRINGTLAPYNNYVGTGISFLM